MSPGLDLYRNARVDFAILVQDMMKRVEEDVEKYAAALAADPRPDDGTLDSVVLRTVESASEARRRLIHEYRTQAQRAAVQSLAPLGRKLDRLRRLAKVSPSKYTPHQGEREKLRRRVGGFNGIGTEINA